MIVDKVDRVKVVYEGVRVCLVVFNEAEATNMTMSLAMTMFI